MVPAGPGEGVLAYALMLPLALAMLVNDGLGRNANHADRQRESDGTVGAWQRAGAAQRWRGGLPCVQDVSRMSIGWLSVMMPRLVTIVVMLVPVGVTI